MDSQGQSPWNVWALNYFWHHALLVTLTRLQSKPRLGGGIRRDWSSAHRLLLRAIWPKASVVKGICAGLAGQQIQSKATFERQERTSIDGFGKPDISHTVVNNSTSASGARSGLQECPSLPPFNQPPVPGEGALLPHSVILQVLRVGRAIGLATLLLGEGRRQKCAQHMVKITSYSWINFRFILPGLLSLLAPQAETSKSENFLVQLGLLDLHGHELTFSKKWYL